PPCTLPPCARASSSAFAIAAADPASMSGPTSVPGSSGSPMGSESYTRARRATRSSARLACTIRRLRLVQRCPAVPTAENVIARTASSRSALGATIIALLPPSSRSVRTKRPAVRAATAHDRGEPFGHVAALRPRLRDGALEEPLAGERGERGLLGRLPHDRIAAHPGERRVPRPYRDREV